MRGNDVKNQPIKEVDAVILGAGFAGLYMLHQLKSKGFSTIVYETGGGVGAFGIGIDILVLDVTLKVFIIIILSLKNYMKNGRGHLDFLSKKKYYGI